MFFASVRVDKIGVQQLGHQARHARREDSTAQIRVRPDAEPGRSLSYRPYSIAGARVDYVGDYERMKACRGARERKGTQPLLHLLCQVSPSWIQQAGQLHDPENPRNQALFSAANEWSTELFGPGSVLAARLDLDERGGGVVDLFVAPVRRSKTGTLFLSSYQVLEELRLRRKRRKSYSSLQDDWGEYCAKLDPSLRRGREKRGAASTA